METVNLADQPEVIAVGTKLVKPKTQTPAAVPPGLSSTQDFPPLAAPQTQVPPKTQRKAMVTNIASPVIKPIVPVLPNQSLRNVVSKETQVNKISEKMDDPPEKLVPTRDSTRTKQTMAMDGLTSNRPKTKAKPSVISDSSAPIPLMHPKPDQKLTESTEKSTDKPQNFDKLDTAAAEGASNSDMDPVGDPPKAETELVTGPSSQEKSEDLANATTVDSRPATPGKGGSQSSAVPTTRQAQPRTIRVLPTTKAETSSRLPPGSPSNATVAASSSNKVEPSRRGSLASVQLPGTPLSERISDNASFTSTSISRTNSPPPSKIGSAPIRQMTKSQQKKERQARTKLAGEPSKVEDAPVKATVEAPVQAPIIGRKKKAKKPAFKGTTDPTTSATRPSSPPQMTEDSHEHAQSIPVVPAKEKKGDANKSKHDKNEAENPAIAGSSSSANDQQNKNNITAASLFASLVKSGEISANSFDSFKPVAGLNHRYELTQEEIADPRLKPNFTGAQKKQLDAGKAVILEAVNNKRNVTLPDGIILRHLTIDEAQRYVELRDRVTSTPELMSFRSSRHDFNRYIHATSHTVKIPSKSANDRAVELENRFASPQPTQTATSTPKSPFWDSSSLAEAELKWSQMGVEEAEKAYLANRKEAEALEKRLNALIKKNRKLLIGSPQ